MTGVPESAALIRDVVNTAEPQVGRDRWTAPAEAQEWLSGRGLLAGADRGSRLDDADVTRLRALREGLREILRGHAGHDVDRAAVEALDRELTAVPLRMTFGPSGHPVVTAAGTRPVDVAVARLLAAVQDAVRDGSWERLKACSRDTCRWAFYDASRNRSGRWCSMAGCGNIVKMRRAHARAAGPPATE